MSENKEPVINDEIKAAAMNEILGSMDTESGFGAFWKKNGKLLMLFFIRLAEVFCSSFIPSFLGVTLIFINPNENIWALTNMLAMIGFAVINFHFLLKYVAGRDNKKEFYILNGAVYLIYMAASIAAYHLCGYLVYSVMFANLRALEMFGLKTLQSIIICDIITMLSMVVFGIYAYSHMQFIKLIMKKNGADTIELEEEEVIPTKNSQEVETLSTEEMTKALIEEMAEAIEVRRRSYEAMPETAVSDDIEKGDGTAVRFATPENPENDIDEGDYVEENADLVNKNKDYSGDSLWNKDIYKGNEPIESYDEEEVPVPEKPSLSDNIKGFLGHHIRSITRIAVVRHRNRMDNMTFDDQDATDILEDAAVRMNSNDGYDSDSLWNTAAYEGRSRISGAEADEDFDIDFEHDADNNFADYDGDNLWNNVHKGRILDTEEAILEMDAQPVVNPNMDYDSDSLWNTNIRQGRVNSEDE